MWRSYPAEGHMEGDWGHSGGRCFTLMIPVSASRVSHYMYIHKGVCRNKVLDATWSPGLDLGQWTGGLWRTADGCECPACVVSLTCLFVCVCAC